MFVVCKSRRGNEKIVQETAQVHILKERTVFKDKKGKGFTKKRSPTKRKKVSNDDDEKFLSLFLFPEKSREDLEILDCKASLEESPEKTRIMIMIDSSSPSKIECRYRDSHRVCSLV